MRTAEIRTPRLLLRRPSMADLEAFHEMLTDPEVMRYWSTEPHADLETSREWMQRMIDGQESGGDDFVVTLDGVAVGKIGMWNPPEIGFIFSRKVWGLGIAVEAANAFIDYIFAAGATHLTADVDPANAACLKLLDRLGFSITGTAEKTYFIKGEWADSVYLRLDAPGA